MNKNFYGKGVTFRQWHYKYSNEKFIDLLKYLSNSDLIILQKFDILLENRLYTEREFDIFNMQLLSYFNEDYDKQLSILYKIKVLKEDYDKILNIFNKIAQIYDL